MNEKDVQLVVPRQLHETFSVAQRKWLMDIGEFITLVLAKQGRASIKADLFA
jgi:hypothetical protein